MDKVASDRNEGLDGIFVAQTVWGERSTGTLIK